MSALHNGIGEAPSRKPHIAGIDGLRAVAVGSVLAFHATGWPRSGFVGVDIFFVISGFVVTLSMAGARPDGFAALAASFYARRFVRIAPALVVCLLVTTAMSCLFIPDAWLSFGNLQSGLAAFFGFSNVVIARLSGDYFSPKAEFNPFTHTWSLGVEEQFYLIFPALMFVFVRAAGRERDRRRALAVLGIVCLLSLVLCAYWTGHWRPSAFYLAPARIWELGCGVALFLSRSAWEPLVRRLAATQAEVVAAATMLLLAASLTAVKESAFPFPGALAPVVGAAMLLALIVARAPTLATRWLSSPLAVYVGRISYSLYLWHWPVFVLMRWTIGVDGIANAATAVGTSFLLAVLSYHLVETPLRRSRSVANAPRRRVVVAGLILVSAACGVAFLIVDNERRISLSATADSQTWLPDSILAPAGITTPCTIDVGSSSLAGGSVQSFLPRDCDVIGGGRRLFVAGDSHALAYSGLLRLVAAHSGREVHLVYRTNCALFDMQRPIDAPRPECRDFFLAAVKELSQRLHRGDTLLLASLRLPRYGDQWGSIQTAGAMPSAALRRAAVDEARTLLRPLADRGVTIVFEAPPPIFKAPPFRCSDWFNRMNTICVPGFAVDRAELERLREPVLSSMYALLGDIPQATIWDPFPVLCPSSVCNAFSGGQPLFFDADHLSGAGNARLFGSFFAHLIALDR